MFSEPHDDDPRTTSATLLLEQCIDVSVIQEIRGHSTSAETKRYTHVTSRLAKEAAERMSRALWDTPDVDADERQGDAKNHGRGIRNRD